MASEIQMNECQNELPKTNYCISKKKSCQVLQTLKKKKKEKLSMTLSIKDSEKCYISWKWKCQNTVEGMIGILLERGGGIISWPCLHSECNAWSRGWEPFFLLFSPPHLVKGKKKSSVCSYAEQNEFDLALRTVLIHVRALYFTFTVPCCIWR